VSIIDAVLVYVGIPAAVILVIFGLVYAGSSRRGRRYRPGRPFEFRAVWFLSAPDQLAPDGHAAIGAGDPHAALPAGSGERLTEEPLSHGATGGASDRW
jgi:hypothetical protein